MSWTSATIVKQHLLGFTVDGLTVRSVEIIFGESDEQLPHQHLEINSARIASLLEDEPTGPVDITLTGTNWYGIGATDIKQGSLAVAPDNQPSSFYIEGVDYVVNYDDGEIKRLTGGNITSGDTVKVWYLPLTVYIYHNDYTINHAEGVLIRSIGSTIPTPARLIIDYVTNGSGVTDTLIDQAIIEAEDKIEARLKDGYPSAVTEQGIMTGATELALSIICDDLAIEALGSGLDSGADDRAKRYMDLARRYEERAAATLARFLNQPVISEGVLKTNPPSVHGW